VIAVIGATLVFAMALVMAGLSGSFHAETKRTVDAVGADYFVVPADTGGPFSSPSAVPGQVVQLERKTDRRHGSGSAGGADCPGRRPRGRLSAAS